MSSLRLVTSWHSVVVMAQSRCLLNHSARLGATAAVTPPSVTRGCGLHTSTSVRKTGHYKITPKGDLPLTYEQANPPHRIGITKSWNTWNASTLHNSGRHPMNIATEDEFIRQFIRGTWYKIWLSEVIIKRQHNNISICGVVCPLPSTKTVHFLTGYTEELLAHLFKCNVKVWVQAVNSKNNLVYKHI